eukprot:6382087-Prymnesium_polylepis.1
MRCQLLLTNKPKPFQLCQSRAHIGSVAAVEFRDPGRHCAQLEQQMHGLLDPNQLVGLLGTALTYCFQPARKLLPLSIVSNRLKCTFDLIDTEARAGVCAQQKRTDLTVHHDSSGTLRAGRGHARQSPSPMCW